MQTTAIRTVANSLPEKGVILLTLLISDRYILFAELRNNVVPLIKKAKDVVRSASMDIFRDRLLPMIKYFLERKIR